MSAKSSFTSAGVSTGGKGYGQKPFPVMGNYGSKDNKVWLICAYHRETDEIVAFVRGKRNLKTAKRLKKKLSDFGVNYGRVATGDRDSFRSTFSEGNHLAGKEYTVGI